MPEQGIDLQGMEVGVLEGERLIARLARRRPFDRMERSHLEWLVSRLREVELPAGAAVLDSGDSADRLWIVGEGTVRAEAAGSAADGRVGAELGPGDCFPLEELHLRRPVLFRYQAGDAVRLAELLAEDFLALQAISAPFRETCERRSRSYVDKLRRFQQAQLVGADSLMNPASAITNGPREVASRIRLAADVPALAAAAAEVHVAARRMMDQGIAPAQVTRLVSTLNDRVTERVVQLELDRAGLPGLDLCWMALGSEGRSEQTLCTDQDNGLVFAPPDGVAPEAVRERLLPVAERINGHLEACGFPRCEGGVMAGNPEWCLSEAEWRGRFARWLDLPEPEALLRASIFFDLRAVYGSRQLVERLQAYVAGAAPARRRFLVALAAKAVETRLPLGVLWGFKLETKGDQAGTVDLKREVVRAFVDGARVLALGAGSTETSTERRLSDAAARGALEPSEAQACADAFHFVQHLRLRHHYACQTAGRPPDNRLRPAALNPVERRFLVEAMRQAKRLLWGISQLYGVQA